MMPAMNIKFTEEQLERHRARAAAAGIPVTRMLAADCEAATELDLHRARVCEASAAVGAKSTELEAWLADH